MPQEQCRYATVPHFSGFPYFLQIAKKIVDANSFITCKNWFVGDENQPKYRSNPPEVFL